jgi:glycosyltransferase involved in cell wall biosynthesis
MMTTNPDIKISVIIPAFNAEKYIAKAIKSCLSQTCPPHEIIVIDDASTDRTAEIAESFSPSVCVIRLAQNSGVSVARNRGVLASTGNWIAFLDADDWFLPEKLERQRRCAVENMQAVLIYTDYRIIAADGSERDPRFISPRKLWPMLRYRNPINLCSVMLRREAFDEVGGFDPSLRVAQDWDLWLKLAARYSVELFAAIPEPVVIYRSVSGSLSSSAMRYFFQRHSIIEGSCLSGTSGISRFLWRRRISAFNYYDTSIALREEGFPLFLFYMLKSIAAWPFPWKEMRSRYKITAVMVKQRFFGIHARPTFFRNRAYQRIWEHLCRPWNRA